MDERDPVLGIEPLPSSWAMLEPHAQRDALFLVGERIDLVEAGRAIAADETEQVGLWIQGGELRRPTQAELDEWAERPVAFQVVIVQPYVLAKPISAVIS